MILLLLSCGDPPAPPPAPEPPPPPTGYVAPQTPRKHALVLIIDTLRADVVAEVDTPNLDALAAAGDSVPKAWSAGTWTVPSVVSMMTGMPVRQHGWNHPTGQVKGFPILPPTPTLAEVLKDEGFATDGLYANDYLVGDLGFARGFDSWKRVPDSLMAKRVGKLVEGWGDERHFLYVHLLGPHSPLHPSDARRDKHGVDPKWTSEHKLGFLIGVCKRNRKEGARPAYEKAYRAVVEDVDDKVGAILAALGEHRDDTAILVTSDHGELIGDHGICGHGHQVWEELTHVPLLGEGIGALPDNLGGASVPALVTNAVGVKHAWPTSADRTLPLVSRREEKLAMSDGRYKGIWTKDGLTVYDLQTDPGETAAVATEVERFEALRADWDASNPPGTVVDGRIDLHPETVEALKTLGYVQ